MHRLRGPRQYRRKGLDPLSGADSFDAERSSIFNSLLEILTFDCFLDFQIDVQFQIYMYKGDFHELY